MKGVHNYPVHLLNKQQGKLFWHKNHPVQRLMMANLHKAYPGGVGVGLRNRNFIGGPVCVIAMVDGGGNVRYLSPPFPTVPDHKIANKPRSTECQCASWFHVAAPEGWAKAPSDVRKRLGVHHPTCQFRADAPRPILAN